MYPAVLPPRRKPLFPPLPEDPVSDSSPHEPEIISRDSSSEDDDTEKAAKRRRMLKHAESYLRGEPLYLHSARLRGPVTKNPWGKTVRRAKRIGSGDREGEGGAVKRLKRCEKNDGREVPPTPTQANKGKGISTNRGTNTINDIIPEASTPAPLQIISPIAANLSDRSHSPVSKVKGDRNYTSELNRRNSPFGISKQTDDGFAMTSPFKTPVKKKPKKPLTEVPLVCSPGTFYARPGKPQNLTLVLKSAASHERSVGASFTQPQEHRGLSSKPTPSISTRRTFSRKSTKEQETVSDIIVLAKPAPSSPDIDLKKKRPKIDFTTKSPFVKLAPVQTKPPKGRKKKNSVDKKPIMNEPQSAPVLGVESVALMEPEHGVGIVGEASKDSGEQILNDWLNRHVAASQVGDAPGSRLNANPTSGKLKTSILHPETSFASMPPTTAEPSDLSGVLTLSTEVVSPLPANIITPPDTLQTSPPLQAAAVPLPKPEPTKTQPPLSPNSDTAAILQSTHKSQPPKSKEKAQPETADSEPHLPKAEEQLQSPAALWENTQYQVLAAQKGFFDALQDSPGFGPFLSAETPGQDLLRPISFFDNEFGSMKTPRLDDRATNDESMSSPFKTPGFTSMSAKWRSMDHLGGDALVSPLKTTFGEGGESLLGTAFTPFLAFATPESSPRLTTGRALSPLTFSPLEERMQEPYSSTKIVRFGGGGFGLLDDDDEDEGEQSDGSFGSGSGSGSGFSPACFKEPGQQGAEEGEGLVEEVMEFMGGGVWDIDEELKKMARSSVTTPSGTAGTPRTGNNGKRRGGNAKKRRLYGRKA